VQQLFTLADILKKENNYKRHFHNYAKNKDSSKGFRKNHDGGSFINIAFTITIH